MKPALTHVALGVGELGRTIAFYEKYAKLHVVHDRHDGDTRVVWLSERTESPVFVIVLFEISLPAKRQPSSLQHFGFAVASRAEVDEVAAQAKRDGVLAMEPTYAGPVVGYFCIVGDPDGNQVEFSYGQPIDPRQIEST